MPKFKTKEAEKKYKSWAPIIKRASKEGCSKTAIEGMKRAQRSWIGK